jgi:serine/threonine protein kinase/tetratricopeptide (TPR) repeat protein
MERRANDSGHGPDLQEGPGTLPSTGSADGALPRPSAAGDQLRTEPTRPERPAPPCEAPARDRLASELDKAHILASLFGRPRATFKIDRFTLLDPIGRGAMGDVYAAYDERLERKVAIKLVRRSASTAVHADERLLREAKAMAQLSHPNVIQVYDVDVCDDRVYIAMEYVRGVTLRRWLEQVAHLGPRARLRAVLRQFLATGAGLQAAHEAGLVHRDFKPDNVMVGEDGRPRVGDFGLARLVAGRARERGLALASTVRDRAGESPETAAGPGATPISTRASTLPLATGDGLAISAAWVHTAAGRIVGTPRYMSPEQWRGEPADSRSDQFSFCVALYEALCRRPPFAGESCESLMRAVLAGRIEPAPSGDVPAPILRALERGLVSRPEDRFPDMGALLHALEAWPRRRRRRLTAATATTMVAALAALMYGFARAPEPCAMADTDMDAVWSDARQQALRDAFARAGASSRRPALERTWDAVAAQLTGYVAAWRHDRIDACQDTHVRHTQSSELLDRRLICLDHGRRRIDATLSELARAGERSDVDALLRAPDVAAALPDLAACRDDESLRYGVEPPSGAEAMAVAAIRARLSDAGTLALLGRGEEALAIAAEQRTAAEALSYVPVQAEALYHLGQLLASGDDHTQVDRGEEFLRRATDLATGARHDELVVEALHAQVLSELRNHDTTEQGHRLSGNAFAAIHRLGDHPREHAQALRYRGLLLAKDGALEQAEQTLRSALDVLENDAGAPWLHRAWYLKDLGNTLRDLGRTDEAYARYQEAHALLARLGEEHPYVVNVRFNLAILDVRLGHTARARAAISDILRVSRRDLGDSHPLVGTAYLELANIDQMSGNLADAEEAAVLGLRIYEQVFAPRDARLAEAYGTLGVIRYRRGDYEGARAMYRKSLDGLVARHGADHVAVAFARANLAEVELVLGAHADALASVADARRILRAAGHSEPLMDGFLEGVRGRALLGQGHPVDAVAALQQALHEFGRMDDGGAPLERAAVHWALARAFAQVDGARSARARAQAHDALRRYEQAGEGGHADAALVCRWLGASPRQ